MDSSDLIRELKNAVSCKITSEESVLESHGTDWTREIKPDPLAVIFPESVEDVKKIVIFANQHGSAGEYSGLSLHYWLEIPVTRNRADKKGNLK